jgi:protein O-GlcNAc transferase
MLKQLLSGLLTPKAPPATKPAEPASLQQAINMLRAEDYPGATRVCEQLLESDPGLVRAWELLGVAALNSGDDALARERFERVIELEGNDPQHLANAAEANRRADHCQRAVELIDRALALAPGNPEFLQIRVLALEGCFFPDEALAVCEQALRLNPDSDRLHTTHLRMLNCAGADPLLILEAHREWARRFSGAPAAPLPHANPPTPGRRLRLGYVSGDFRRHAASDFILPLLECHDRGQFEIYCYSNTPKPDDVTRLCQQLVAHWRDITALSDEAAEQLIRADRIDLLVDLSGHTTGNRLNLFARKPAPVQLTYLGYPGTTGMPQMDYRITDGYTDPPGDSDGYYVERLLRVPHSLWCYRPPQGMPEPAPAPLLQSGQVTFGSLNSFVKLRPGTIALWSRLLLQVPGARLLMAGVSASEARERVLQEFARYGVPAESITICPHLARDEFWALHGQIDIALDSFPYNGGATTCATLWLGVPVVSMAGSLFQSRAGLSVLAALGLPELVAGDVDDFLRIAGALANDPRRVAELHATLRNRMRDSPLGDCAAYTLALERLYRTAWQQWCGTKLSDSSLAGG